MGDPLKKVQPGQPLRIPAQTFNTFIDAARDFQERRQGVGGNPLSDVRPAGVVLVKNTTGEDRGLFEIVALDGPVYTPEDNEEGFKFRFAFNGAKPDAAHAGNFAVLLEPVKDGAVGRGLVQGVTPVKVQVDEGDEGLAFADVCTDEGEEFLHLRMAGHGAAQVLWKEDGAGEKWALVRVSNTAAATQQATVHGLKVTGLWKAWGAAWTSFDADGYIAFVSGKFAFLDKSWTDDDGEDLFVKVTGPRGKDAPIGYRGIAVGDYIGWVAGDGFEDIPGSSEHYDGAVVPFIGPEGALPDWVLAAGKGLVLDDPTPYNRTLHVDVYSPSNYGGGLYFRPTDDDAGQLSVRPANQKGLAIFAGSGVGIKAGNGIQFDGSGNATVKPDTAKGIDVTADGVQAKLADAGGLEFDGAGAVKVKPDTARGVNVQADGVRAVLEADKGLQFGAGGGIAVKPDTARGLDVDASGLFAKVDADGGLEHDADGLRVKLTPTGSGGSGLQVSADGLSVAAGRGLALEDNSLHVDLAADPGLEFDGTGEDAALRAKVNTAKAITRTADGLEVVVESNEGIEFESGGGLGLAKPGVYAHVMPVLCNLYLDKNGRIMGWYEPAPPPDYQQWCSPWGYAEP